MPRALLCVGLSCPLWSSSASRAQTKGELWTLERVGTVAVERSPQVQAANAALEASRAYRTFGSMPRVGNPIVNLRAMVGKPDDPAATYSVQLGIPFDVSGRRRAWSKEATWVEREAEARLMVSQNEARAQARDSFVDVALSQQYERVALDNAEIAREFLSRVKARFEARAATALDVALSERDYAESVAAAARAQGALAEARGRLRQSLDLPADDAVETAELAPPSLPEGLTAERAVALAVERRRDPAVFRAGAGRAKMADTRLRREVVAPVVAFGEDEAQGNEHTKKSLGVGLSTELSLLLRNQGERAVNRAQGNVLTIEGELSERAVGREAFVAYQQLAAALAELSAIVHSATPAAERALSMTMEMLDAGAVDYFRLLNARQSAFALRSRRVEALRAAWRLRIALERAVGGLEETP